jgi:hypothetical protein
VSIHYPTLRNPCSQLVGTAFDEASLVDDESLDEFRIEAERWLTQLRSVADARLIQSSQIFALIPRGVRCLLVEGREFSDKNFQFSSGNRTFQGRVVQHSITWQPMHLD